MKDPETPGRIMAQIAIAPLPNRIGAECPGSAGTSPTIQNETTVPTTSEIRLAEVHVCRPARATTEATIRPKKNEKSSYTFYTNYFSGIHGNYHKTSIKNAGLDPDNLPESDPSKMNFKSGGENAKKVWKDIWGCGQGIGAVKSVLKTADFVDQMVLEYEAAKKALGPS